MRAQERMNHVVAFLLMKRKRIGRAKIRDVIYTADVYHLISYGRTITQGYLYQNSYELSDTAIHKAMDKKDKLRTFKEHELDTLSISDKDSLLFALSRYEAEIGGIPQRISLKINH